VQDVVPRGLTFYQAKPDFSKRYNRHSPMFSIARRLILFRQPLESTVFFQLVSEIVPPVLPAFPGLLFVVFLQSQCFFEILFPD